MADERMKRIGGFIAPLRVTPGKRVTLAKDFDPNYKADFVRKRDGVELLQRGVELLSEYQERLAAQDTYGVLVVLQALDAAGKDGTIRHVMSGVNPQGVSVHSFKVPSTEELDHDYLWRYAKNLPARGDIGIFNRSYYEEVLVVRVHPENLERQRLPKKARGKDVWTRRYRDINDWERYLTDNGFVIVKLFLNLSQEEQRIRFLRRIDLPDHNWKFSAADAHERSYWDDYQKAFSEMLSATSTEWAPWYVIPADHKWFARICAAAVVANALVEIDPQYPKVSAEARDALQETKVELEAQAPEGATPDPFASQAADVTGKGKAQGKGKAAKKPGKKAAKAQKKAEMKAAKAREEAERRAVKKAEEGAPREAEKATVKASEPGTSTTPQAREENDV
jgi:PPK2 family polyphosphate:nucleotide phosphotransferase